MQIFDDVIVEGENLMGDGVNIAARLESIGEAGGVVLSQTVFDQVKRAAQLSFEDLGEKELKNISEPVRVFRVVGEMGNHSYMSGNPEILEKKAAQGTHPHSIAVLPFANFSDDPEYFADGFCEDLITELARFRGLFVVSRNASFAFKGRNLDLRKVGRELGVAYCLEGSVRRIGKRVRITAQLIDTAEGDHVWAEKYDRELDDLFDIQDELTSAIVSTVVGRIERQSQQAAKAKKPADMEAYDCLLRGLEFHRLGGVTQDSAEQAVAWFAKSLEKDPNYARAHAWRSCAMSTLAREWTHDNVLEEARQEAERALELDDQDAECHRILGSINLYMRDFGKAEHHFQQALEMNPNNAFILGRIGELYNFLGEGAKALEYQERAVQLDPLLPSYCRELEAAAHYVLGEYEKTVAVVDRLPRVSRRAAAYKVAALQRLGDEEAAKGAAAELEEIDPGFTICAFMLGECYKAETPRRALQSDLEAAGLRLE